MVEIDELHKLQKALLSHFLERERLSRRIRKLMGQELGLVIHRNDVWVYEQVTRKTDEAERQAIEKACK